MKTQAYTLKKYFDADGTTTITKAQYNAATKALREKAKKESLTKEEIKELSPKFKTTYHTEPDGKGSLIKSVVAIGEGMYYDRGALDDAELAAITQANVKRVAEPRLNAALQKITLLTNAAKNPLINISESQATKIMAHMTTAMQELEHALFNIKETKAEGVSL